MEAQPPGRKLYQVLRAAHGGGIRRLAGLISRYGKAIAYDLLTICNGMRLAVEWRERRWAQLLYIIDRLPRNSAFMEALSDDDTVAARMLAMPRPQVTDRRRMSEYSVDVEMLSLLADRIAELIGVTAAARGIKPRRIPPAPRPVTALERLRKSRRRDQHQSLVAKLLPHKANAVDQQQPAPANRMRPSRPPTPPRRAEPRTLRSGWLSP